MVLGFLEALETVTLHATLGGPCCIVAFAFAFSRFRFRIFFIFNFGFGFSVLRLRLPFAVCFFLLRFELSSFKLLLCFTAIARPLFLRS